MKTIQLTIGETDYTLATSLRVAYVIQGMNNHKAYLDVFKEIDKMTIEKQVEFLYAAYSVAATDTPMPKNDFLNICLDNLDLSGVMGAIKQIIEGITGKTLKSLEEESVPDEVDSKN